MSGADLSRGDFFPAAASFHGVARSGFNDTVRVTSLSSSVNAAVWSDYKLHARLLQENSSGSSVFSPILYCRISENSSSGVSAGALERYAHLEEQLLQLAHEPDSDGVAEGAVQSARSVSKALLSFGYPPPELTWHGGDAVVMLWAVGDTTYAITITEGEMGYVVRRDRRTIKSDDSLPVESALQVKGYLLEDFR